MKTNFKEGLVENKLLKNRVGLNAPSSMVLFYTWIILIVLIAVVSLSAFRYRCKVSTSGTMVEMYVGVSVSTHLGDGVARD